MKHFPHRLGWRHNALVLILLGLASQAQALTASTGTLVSFGSPTTNTLQYTTWHSRSWLHLDLMFEDTMAPRRNDFALSVPAVIVPSANWQTGVDDWTVGVDLRLKHADWQMGGGGAIFATGYVPSGDANWQMGGGGQILAGESIPLEYANWQMGGRGAVLTEGSIGTSFAVSAVPEPSVGALMVASLIVLGLTLRRRIGRS